jgi:hypothetical protein
MARLGGGGDPDGGAVDLMDGDKRRWIDPSRSAPLNSHLPGVRFVA